MFDYSFLVSKVKQRNSDKVSIEEAKQRLKKYDIEFERVAEKMRPSQQLLNSGYNL